MNRRQLLKSLSSLPLIRVFSSPSEAEELTLDLSSLGKPWTAIEFQFADKTGLIPGIVFGNMLDYCRRVSKHTVIGAAYREGKARGAYFILTLEAAQST